MNIIFCSIVRNGTSYLGSYLKRLSDYASISGHDISLAICEGDSTDNSYWFIQNNKPDNIDLFLYNYNHGGQEYGSVNVPERWQNIARTWNHLFDQLDFRAWDRCVYMESDLTWDFYTIEKLLVSPYDVTSPMSMIGNIFYDTWGHRSNGVHFTNQFPFHPDFNRYKRYMPLESAGSCLVAIPEVFNTCRLSEVDAMIGHDIVKNGFSFMLDKTARVTHG